MSPDEESDIATLNDLVAACLRIAGYVRGASRSDLDRNNLLLSACCYQIAVIGEAVKRISPATRSKCPQVPWKEIAGMRDRLIHGYDSVDIDELWKTATEDVPALLEQVRTIQAEDFGLRQACRTRRRPRFAARFGSHVGVEELAGCLRSRQKRQRRFCLNTRSVKALSATKPLERRQSLNGAYGAIRRTDHLQRFSRPQAA
jgi:uncharacterized protein with HEPN domain